MKKFFAIALIATALVSCNDGDKKVTETTDSDTTTVVMPTENTADTMQVVTDSTVKTTVEVDTMNK